MSTYRQIAASPSVPWTDEQWREMSLSSWPSMTPEWASAWFDAYGSGYRLHPAFGERGRDEALLPLVRPRRRPWRLELLGARELNEPMDALSPHAAAVESLMSVLAGSGESLVLRRVPEGSPLVSAARQAYRGRGVVVVRRTSSSPTLPLDRSWEEPERHMSSRRRSDLRRAHRRATELGDVGHEVVSRVGPDLDKRLDEFVAVEAAGWKTRAGTALACMPEQERFFRVYAHALAARGRLRLSFLRIDGQVAAAQYAVQHADRLWLLKIGYDERFARCSPGTLLMLRSVSNAATEGARAFEFLGSSEPWTARWTESERSYVQVLAYGRKPHALVCLGEDAYRVARRVAGDRRDSRASRSEKTEKAATPRS